MMIQSSIAAVLIAAAAGSARGDDPVPLPRPRPPIVVVHEPKSFAEAVAGLDFDAHDVSAEPTACDKRLAAFATIDLLPRRIGPGACGGRDLVTISSVLLPDKSRIAIEPAATLNCPMAESLASWLRDEAAPDIARLGSTLRAVENYDSYECRTRNRIPGAKVSEHAHGDAIDVRAFKLADGRRLEPTDVHVDKPLRVALHDAVCRRFTTVLGPGDPYHSNHIHLDVIQRRAGYRICHWDVREPMPMVAAAAGAVPLPRPRPAVLERQGSASDEGDEEESPTRRAGRHRH